MFSTRASREGIFRGLRIGLIMLAAALMIIVTFVFPQWTDPYKNFAGPLIAIGTTILWFGAGVWFGYWLFCLYEEEKYKSFVFGATAASLMGPTMTFLGMWGTANYRNFVLDLFMIASWIYAVANIVTLAVYQPDFIKDWIQSGASRDAIKARRQEERAAKKAAARKKATLAENGEPVSVETDGETKVGTYEQPPLMTDEERYTLSQMQGVLDMYALAKLSDKQLVRRVLSQTLTFGRVADTESQPTQIKGSWDLVVDAFNGHRITAPLFYEIATEVRKLYPAARLS